MGYPYKHCNLLLLCLLVKTGSETVIRPIVEDLHSTIFPPPFTVLFTLKRTRNLHCFQLVVYGLPGLGAKQQPTDSALERLVSHAPQCSDVKLFK